MCMNKQEHWPRDGGDDIISTRLQCIGATVLNRFLELLLLLSCLLYADGTDKIVKTSQ